MRALGTEGVKAHKAEEIGPKPDICALTLQGLTIVLDHGHVGEGLGRVARWRTS